MNVILCIALCIAAFLLGVAVGASKKQKEIGGMICRIIHHKYAQIEDINERIERVLPAAVAARSDPIKWAMEFINKNV